MSSYVGELAALLTAFMWMLSSLCWTAAGERIGSLAVNVTRLIVALPMLMVSLLVTQGEVIPLSASREAWLYLSLSGAFGFFVCDLFLFQSFLMIGPRLGMLILSLAPPLTAFLGWLVLDEHLTLTNWIGMGLTLSGVAWVVLQSPSATEEAGRRYVFSLRGGLVAFIGAAAQAVAMIFAKMSTQDEKSPIAMTEIRLIAGLACFLVLLLALRRYPMLFRSFTSARTMGIITMGAVAGPFVGVTLMMVAVSHISTGLAQTFLALAPVMIIPFMRIMYGERVRASAVAGTVLAFAGVGLLFIK